MMKIPLLFLLIFGFPQGNDQLTLTISVSGLKPLKGDLYISLHNRPEYFQVADSAFMKMKVTVNEENEMVLFNDIPAGTYAIALYHDENMNGVMETNEKGIPREGYGFSTKSRFFGQPKFEQAAFEVTDNMTIEIKMGYPPSSAPK
jgi:uncharacterized protein (DUF2141 family)